MNSQDTGSDEEIVDWEDYDFLDTHDIPNDFSIAKDAYDRLEKTIDKQFILLNDIDNKAKSLAQYTAILVGIVLTALTLLRGESIGPSNISLFTELSFFIGVVSLILAIIQSIHTYLSSVIEYGMSGEFAIDIAERKIEDHWYLGLGLISYADAANENVRVIDTNARRFRWAAFLLVLGLIFISLSAGFFIAQPGRMIESAMFFVVIVAMFWYFCFVYREEYLVLERES